MFVAVLAIAPVAGIPPKSGLKIFATPWAISSMFELCLLPIIPSATAALKSDSIAARTAIDRLEEDSCLIKAIEKDGICGAGKDDGISPYRLPIVAVSQPKNFFKIRQAIVESRITISEPGIFLLIFGHTKMTASDITATKVVYKSIVPKVFAYTATFPTKLPGIAPV